ncbi:SCO family protein [Natrinema caseinilyticum]|uniref:SCO family protein n=1 Tax=Natrinema caseinilyticum TaxID=2961570 RepID=UPI0020C4E7A6|nr:SCO family protein [Natrinema caseinilyticum]
MDRRTYLGTVGMAGLTSVAGCLGGVLGSNGGNTETVLEPPETDLSEASHPSYGQDLPSLNLPDPLSGETISTDQYEDERVVLMTFIYTNCPNGMCPALTLRLRRVQEVAATEGYSDSVALLAMTFDPERDTAEALQSFANQRGVDTDAENWHFLRPESYDEAKQIMTEQIGLPLEKRDAEQYDDLEYAFPHYNLILLANERGIIERAYPKGATNDIQMVVDDVETVVKA